MKEAKNEYFMFTTKKNDNLLDIIASRIPARLYLFLGWHLYKLRRKNQYLQYQSLRKKRTESGYSYLPFDESRCIFIHIPKCAGISINKALFGNLAGGHTSMEEYIHIFEPENLQNYFKFTIVRNPWDRVVSAYHFLKNGGFNEKDKKWFDSELSAYDDFDGFVKNWLTKDNIWKWHHFRPQYSYMFDRRHKVKLDYIGFFENIDNDFSYISKRLNTSCRLPKSNMSIRRSYSEYYTKESAEIVAEIYSDDIKTLGYSFDNSTLMDQVRLRDEIYLEPSTHKPKRPRN